MSQASSFLKRRAEERKKILEEKNEASSSGGSVQTTTQNSLDMPLGGGQDGAPATRASDFLRKRAEERAAIIDQEYGADAYGGTEWREPDKVSGFNSWLSDVASLSEQLSKDYATRQGQYQSQDDFNKYHTETAAAIDRLVNRGNTYRNYFTDNASLFDEEMLKSAQDVLTQYGDYLNTARGDLDYERDYWSQFEDEDAYKGFLDQQERNTYLTTYDVADGQNTLAEKQEALDEAKKAKNSASTVLSGVQRYGTQEQREQAQARLDEATAAYEALLAEVQTLEKDIYDAENLQKGLTYNDYLSAGDYAQYSSQGAAIENPALADVEKGITIFGRNFGGQKPGNIVTYSRDNWEQIAMGEANNSQMTGRSLYHYMTDDEVGIYNYLLAKEGQDAAQEYLDYLEETLNYRFGTSVGENIRGIENDVGRTLMTGLYGFGAGLDQWASGTRQLFSSDRLPTTATQFGSAYIREDLAESGPEAFGSSLGQVAYDATNIIGNMAPSILVSAVTGGAGAPAAIAKGAGALTMGASSAGNAYSQKLNEGYSAEQARTYSTLVGAAEGGLQYLLGGIGALGGVTDDILLAKVASIDNALARVALTGAVKLGSEITEEELQLFLEPTFESLIFGTEYDAPTFEDMAYTAIVTALSTGVLEGGDIVSAGFTAPTSPGKATQAPGPVAEISPEAPTAAPVLAPDSMTNSDIAAELVNAGATEAEAESLAPVIAAVLTGEEISGNQAGAIAKNEAAVSVLGNATGEEINTDAPLGEVKATIRGLASRQSAATETAATEDTPAPAAATEAAQSPVEAPTPVTAEDMAQRNVQAIADFAKTMDKAGATALTKMYNEGQNAEQYIAGMIRAYNAGKNGTSRAEIINDLQGITGTQAQAAYIAGQADADGAQTVAKTNKADYTIGETTNEEGVNNGTETVYLRESSQRDHSANSGRGLRQLEESTGRDPGWQTQTEPADSEASNLSYGREVSSADLGIDGGVDSDAVYLVTSGSTAATRAAKAEADKRGLKLVLFGGGDIHSALAPGGANGYVDETTMYVRADDPDFTADQIARHEGGHDMIRKGEVDIAEVRSRIEKLVGGKGMVETAAELYAWAYEGSTLTPEQVWEECICDSLGDMNIFAGALDGLGDFIPNLHATVKSAVAESTRAPRGPPDSSESKASRRKRSDLDGQETEKSGKLAQDRQVAARGAEKAGAAGIDGRRSGSGSAGSRADQVRYQDLTKYEQERVSELLVTPVDNCPEWAAVIRRIPINTAAESLFNAVVDGAPVVKILAAEVPGFAEAVAKVRKFVNRQAPKGRSASTSRDTSPSGEYDADGGQLTVAQAEFFKNSKIRDANGRLLVLYHGSRSEAFSVFDLYEGVWLTPDQRYAEIYADNWRSWRDDMGIGLEDRALNGLEPEIYADPDLRLYKMYANGEKPVNLGELDGPLTERKVRELARKLGVKTADLRKLAEPYMDEYTYSLTRSHEFMELAKAHGFDSFAATESGRETYCIFASPDQVALTTNKTPSSNPDVRYSRRLNLDNIKGKADEVAATLETYHAELNQEYRALEEQDRQFKETAEYQKFLDAISKSGIKSDNLDKVVAEYSAWEKASGYGQVVKDMEALRGEMKTVLGRLQRVKEQAAKDAREAYRALYSEEFSKKYANKAARKFGTTSRFDLAGYLTVNGSLLDFSERQGYRVQDHREIAEVLDFLPEDPGYSDGLIEFMNMGNIRMQSYGIDISQPPNAKQVPILRRFFAHLDGEVTVDFSRENGDSAGSVDYAEGTRPDKILRDIDYFFKNGEVPEQSDVARFHGMYSRRLSLNEEDTQDRFAPEFYSKMERAVEAIKGNKIGAASVVPYLTGRGIKAEEIKWSGLSSYLAGKKSVNRDELLAYLRDNRLEIQEEVLEDEKGTRPQTFDDQMAELEAQMDTKVEEAAELWQKAYGEPLPAALLDGDTADNITLEIMNRNGGIRDFVGVSALSDAERKLYLTVAPEIKQISLRQEDLWDRAQAYSVNTSKTKWMQYKLDGGENYREFLYKMPGSDYTNRAMQVHWGDNTGVLAHARVQDFEHNGEPVMFVEEIQSDWHNAGQKLGYSKSKSAHDIKKRMDEIDRQIASLALPSDDLPDEEWFAALDVYHKKIRQLNEERSRLFNQWYSLKDKGPVPDAPYSKTYHEYVLKSLLRKAAEGGYSYLAWTPGWLQEERWSDEYAEGYRIEYDQDIPKFLNKYGKQWGARAEDISLDGLRNITVHAIPITDEMRGSVLYEGQPKFSRKIVSFDDLREENRLLKERLDELKGIEKQAANKAKQAEYWKGQTRRTTQPTLRQEDVDKLAKRLIRDYEGTVAAEDVAGELKALGEFIMRGGDGKNELTWTEVKDRAVSIARDIAESAEALVDNGEAETYREIRSRLRKQRIAFNDQGDIADYGDFRKRNMGKFILAKDGLPIDVLWGELNSTYGEGYFPSDIIHPADQLVHLAELLDDLRPVYENPHSRYMAEAVEYLANDIVDSLIDESVRQTAPTFADRQAAKLSEQKAKDAQRLSALREQKNAKIKDIRQRGVEKTREAVQRVRDDRDRKLRTLKRHYQQKEARGRDNRKAAALRHKIQKHAKELSRELLRPTDKHHIPEALRTPVARLLEAINLESNYELEYGKDAKYHRVKPGESLYAEATKRTQAFAALKEAYAKIGGDLVVDPALLGIDGETGWLDEVIAMAGKPIADMNSKELETVWQTIKAVENSIRTANKAFAAGKFQSISEAAGALLAENKGKTGPNENPRISKAQNLLRLDMLTPEAYFHRLGKVGDTLFRSMRNAQDQHIRIMKQVADFTHELLKDTDVRKLERTLHTVELGEEKVTLSTAQLMELHALIRRGEQAINHILVGGILPEARAGKENGKRRNLARSNTPVRGITWEQLAKAVSLLSPEEIDIADALQGYLSGPMSEHGNKASMEVYNYKKFTEERYWPIRSNSQDIRKQDAAARNNVVTSPANYGMTKATKPKSDTSLQLGSLFDTFSTHTSQMATYSAWLGVTEDLNRIRNFMFRNEQGERTGGVQEILDRVHGRGGGEYLQKLLSDISIGVKGRHAETNYGGALIGNFKAAAVGANLRVIAQQPTAILRAMEQINPKYLLAGNLKPFAGWKKARKYAPIAQWKDWGYFDIHTGRQMKDVLFETDSPLDKARNFTMAGASLADSYAWGVLWNACEMEVRAERANLAIGSAEYYQTVAERFTEIVDHSQVVDGIMQRSQIMRSDNELTKMATSFMAEPTKQYNALMSAVYDFRNAQGKAAKKTAGGRLARVTTVLFVAAMVNAAVQSLVDALRDDEKERDYWDRFFEAYTGIGEDGFTAQSLLDGNAPAALNPLSMIPFAKDIFSAISGYEVTRMDFELISDLTDAGKNLVKALNGSGKMTLQAAAANFAMVAAKAMGISVSNFKRDAMAIANEVMAAAGNYELRYRLLKETRNFNYSSNVTEVMNLLYEAMCNDEDAYELIKRDLVADDALKTETTSTAQRIKDNMKQKYNKAVKAGKAPTVSQKILDELGITTSYTPKKEEDKFGEEDLSAAQYERYNSQRASTYRTVVDEISSYPGWSEVDGEIKDKVSNAATTYAKETALAANSSGRYEAETKWIYWANGGESYQVNEAEAIFFKVLYDSIPGDEKNGKTVSGSKKKNVLAAAEEYMPYLSDTALEYLAAFYWTPGDSDLKQRKENGWK